jgi:hypothetical protein
MIISPELAAYLILGFVDRVGSTAAARKEIETMKAAGKSFDEILDTLEATRLQAESERRDAIDKMPGD